LHLRGGGGLQLHAFCDILGLSGKGLACGERLRRVSTMALRDGQQEGMLVGLSKEERDRLGDVADGISESCWKKREAAFPPEKKNPSNESTG